MAGRRQTIPTQLKLLRGNPGKRPLPKDEPEPAAGAEMPDWLSKEAAAHWPVVARQLEQARVLSQLDGAALGLYCEAFARWRNASDLVAIHGMVTNAGTGRLIQSPYLTIAIQASEQMTKMLVEFGMTPSSRTRVKTTSKDAGRGDDLEEFVG